MAARVKTLAAIRFNPAKNQQPQQNLIFTNKYLRMCTLQTQEIVNRCKQDIYLHPPPGGHPPAKEEQSACQPPRDRSGTHTLLTPCACPPSPSSCCSSPALCPPNGRSRTPTSATEESSPSHSYPPESYPYPAYSHPPAYSHSPSEPHQHPNSSPKPSPAK